MPSLIFRVEMVSLPEASNCSANASAAVMLAAAIVVVPLFPAASRVVAWEAVAVPVAVILMASLRAAGVAEAKEAAESLML